MDKKRMALLFACFFITLLFTTACKSDGNQGGIVSNSQETRKLSIIPADSSVGHDSAITITAVAPIPSDVKFIDGESMENNPFSRMYLNDLGIDIRYIWTAPESQYEEKLNAAISAHDLPDMMYASKLQFQHLTDSDQLEDLSKAFDQFASPLVKEIYQQDQGVSLNTARKDGKLLGIPLITSNMGDSSQLLWIRKDWLDKLKLPEPKTMKDVFTISAAFTKDDPDGNHVNDSYGLAVSKDLWGYSGGIASLDGFFNGYHAYPRMWIKDKAGKVVYGSVQLEMKAALAKLQEMYEAGQIDPEFAVKDSTNLVESLNTGKIGMEYGQMWNPLYPFQDAVNHDPTIKWMPYAIPSIDDQSAKTENLDPIHAYYVVHKGTAHPEALIKVLNRYVEAMYGSKRATFQSLLDKYDPLPIYKYSFTNIEPMRKNLDAYIAVRKAIESKDPVPLNFEQKTYYNKILAYQKGDSTAFGLARVFGAAGSFSIIKQYVDDNLLLTTAYLGAPTETMSEKQSSLNRLETETFTKIIMGSASIDEFDKFVAEWNRSGGDSITAEVNVAMPKS